MGGESSGVAIEFVILLVFSTVASYIQRGLTKLGKRNGVAVCFVGLSCRLSPALSNPRSNLAFFQQPVLVFGHF